MPGVCLSVSLSLSRSNFTLKKLLTDLRENFTTDVSVDMEELVKFWKSSAPGSGSRIFLKDSSTFQDRAFFHNSARISGQSDRIFVKSLTQM